MSALKFKDRIRIEHLAPPAGDPSDPDYGAGLDNWQTFAEAWAEIQDVLPSRAEETSGGLRLAADAARVRMRYRAGITADMRIVEKAGRQRVLGIISGPAAVAGMRELEFMVERFSS